ncbi:hypothetical protein SAMN06265218_10394 [Fodinibius sediminis]|uniref:Uncharacterized protein n=1 Tax=Fodinibius sediminis TaxID=1214077 RepID=A0A521BGK7_9BACT|nr:hypothetical protein SAMN06265218_10394 [Fodinibius sediminis]
MQSRNVTSLRGPLEPAVQNVGPRGTVSFVEQQGSSIHGDASHHRQPLVTPGQIQDFIKLSRFILPKCGQESNINAVKGINEGNGKREIANFRV